MSILKNLPFEWLVGLRYTRAGKRSGRNSFISFISLISMAGIGLGVAALIVVLSVMNGFQKEVTDRMLSVLAHVEIFDARGSMPNWEAEAAQARKNPEVMGTAPFAETQGMLVRDDVLRPSIIRGVLPEQEPNVSDVAKQTKRGNFNAPGESGPGQMLMSVTAVPEADTWAMLAAGLGLIGFMGRRQSRRSETFSA